MTRIDLDDLPPRIADLLTKVEAGEDVVLVQHGAVVGRLIAAAGPAPAVDAEPEPAPDARAAEIFEQFRSAIEEDF